MSVDDGVTTAPHPDAATSPLPDRGPDLDRLVAQRGFFTGPHDHAPERPYATVTHGFAVLRRGRARLDPRSEVTQHTYFGRFPASYWQRWTSVTEVVLEARVAGRGRVLVRASDREGVPRTVHAHAVEDDRPHRVDLPVALDRFVDGGAVWAEFRTEEHALEVSDVRWSVTAPSRLRPTAVVICTHDRADDCLATLQALVDDPWARLLVDAVYVIDQGEDRVDSRPAFAEVAAGLEGALRYRCQPNLGGSGGFTRGLYEVADVAGSDRANVLFTDDDILLEPDTIVRLTAFANRCVEPVIVGAQMLHLLHPHKIHTGGETADFRAVEPGLAVANALDKADVTEEFQDIRVDADYNAWWTCLIPSEVVTAVGYPLPFFFQWDDVEYGYRALRHGHATVTLPGAAVWHHDFDWKDEDDWSRYFTLRNALMIDALHGDFDPAASARSAGRWIARCLVSMRYGQAETLLLAVEDFLRGPDSLRDGGVAAVAAVRALRARHPETVRHPASAVPGVPAAGRPVAVPAGTPSREDAVLAKRLVWQLRGRLLPMASIAAKDAHWWHVSRYRTAVVTDASQQGVRVRRHDHAELVRLSRRSAHVLLRLRREGADARRRLLDAVPELSGREHWRRLFAAAGEFDTSGRTE